MHNGTLETFVWFWINEQFLLLFTTLSSIIFILIKVKSVPQLIGHVTCTSSYVYSPFKHKQYTGTSREDGS